MQTFTESPPSSTGAEAAGRRRAGGRAALAALALAAFAVAALAAGPHAGAATGYGPYTVQRTGSNGLNERSGPSTTTSVLGNLPNGSSVFLACQTAGGTYTTGGTPASEDIWDQLTSGAYVADYFLSTPGIGTFSAGIPRCGTPPPPPPPPPPAPGDLGSCIGAGTAIHAGQYLESTDGRFTLQMQSDGNLVVYQGGVALWDPIVTGGHPGAGAVLQSSDGNFVVYPSTGSALWAANTSGNPGDSLCMQTDGNLVIYSSGHAALWATMTNEAASRGATASADEGAAGECTWWAEAMFAKYTGSYLGVSGNAYQWAGSASAHGWTVSGTPRANSVVVFGRGVDGASATYGHVAWVLDYYPSSNRILVSEMNWKAWDVVDTRITTAVASGESYIYANP